MRNCIKGCSIRKVENLCSECYGIDNLSGSHITKLTGAFSSFIWVNCAELLLTCRNWRTMKTCLESEPKGQSAWWFYGFVVRDVWFSCRMFPKENEDNFPWIANRASIRLLWRAEISQKARCNESELGGLWVRGQPCLHSKLQES